MKRRSYRKIVLFCMAALIAGSCTKSPEFVDTDPATGQPTVALTTETGDCNVVKISQKNGNSGADNAFEIKRNATLIAQSISSYDSLLKKLDYNITLQTVGDSIRLSTGEYFLLDKATKQVVFFSTHADLQDPNSDKQVFQYSYDTNGYLIKKLQFINDAANADYETNYVYVNGVLKSCTVLAGSKKDVLLQSVLDFDLTTARRSWLYLFPDFFEGYNYLQAMPFGKRSNYAVKSITTNIYDLNDGSVLDTWTTTFSGYVYSKDGFILQTTAKGDLQQGLGLLFGTTRFDYQCTQ
jgi:hypothetical protein